MTGITGLILITSLFAGEMDMNRTEISIDIWDWTEPCQDIEIFEVWVKDFKSIGGNLIEISVPWRVMEPNPGEIDTSWLEARLAVCKKYDMPMRLRINSYYAGAKPDWYDGELWKNVEGEVIHQGQPSIVSDYFWQHFGPVCTAIAEVTKGWPVYHNAFIGIHAELKFADWWSYDDAAMALWREAIHQTPRPDWLLAVVDQDTPLSDHPDVPENTEGLPDLNPESRAWIAFREHCWHLANARFAEAIYEANPDALISAPLGEAYRRQSAHMSNQDYWGLTRQADQVVHSWDFFWHGQDPSWHAAAAVESFRGITRLPSEFEFDQMQNLARLGYSDAHLMAIGRDAALAGAGLTMANLSYFKDIPPSKVRAVNDLIALWQSDLPTAPRQPAWDEEKTVLLFLSKWANYLYREPTEWLHHAQFGVYKMLRDMDVPVRIICEDNLEEDLSGYRALVLAFSPRALMPGAANARIDALGIPIIEDMPFVPELKDRRAQEHLVDDYARFNLLHPDCPVAPLDLSGMKAEGGYMAVLQDGDGKPFGLMKPGHVVFGFPIGYLYLHGEKPDEPKGMMAWALSGIDRP